MVFRETKDDFILNISNLTVKISNQPIINNSNFKIKRGITLAIIGPNGEGKTTPVQGFVKFGTVQRKKLMERKNEMIT
jgi:ABC-type Mn2+/Zn2+ transport system ATPase subunit